MGALRILLVVGGNVWLLYLGRRCVKNLTLLQVERKFSTENEQMAPVSFLVILK